MAALKIDANLDGVCRNVSRCQTLVLVSVLPGAVIIYEMAAFCFVCSEEYIYIFSFFNSSVYLKPSLFMDALASIQRCTGERVGVL